ncbi:MAG TPA: hypothetical protein VIF40_17990 [Methylosinus sp.]|uniref:hypothetical protein n=1 Tax=Methylosinus sp. TaxID=427 RepID=UPI002F9339F7
MTGLSRRSVLFAPVALAAASMAPEQRPSARYLLGRLRWAPVTLEKPFQLLSTDVRLTSLDRASGLPQIGDQRDGAITDGLSGFSTRVASDDSRRGHSVDLDDQGGDGVVGLVEVVDEQISEQRPQQEPRSGELHGERVEMARRVLRGFRHFLESLVSVATAMVKRAGRVCKSAWPAFISDLIVATAADDEIESIQRAEVRDAGMLWIVVALDSIVVVYLAALFWRAPT